MMLQELFLPQGQSGLGRRAEQREPEVLHTTITEEAEALYASHIEAEDFVL